MPFKSQAQRRKFAQLLVEGKISNKTFEEWNRISRSRASPHLIAADRDDAGARLRSRRSVSSPARSAETAAVRPAVGLERPRHDAKGRTPSLRTVDEPTGDGVA
jgi:hypothetical protein